MTIKFIVACNQKEIDDALWLRHQVYVKEEGLYGGSALPAEQIVDRFDFVPTVAHILAYEGSEPVAGIRLNRDTSMGLPPDEHFDFSLFRSQSKGPSDDRQALEPLVASGGMLAIRRGWRQRRGVIDSIYRVAAGVFFEWGVTHITATVNHATVSIYRRAGFETLANKIWINQIGDHVVPMLAKAEDCYRWAFSDHRVSCKPVWREGRKLSCNVCPRLTINLSGHFRSTRSTHQTMPFPIPQHASSLSRFRSAEAAAGVADFRRTGTRGSR
ncbi:N-acyl amino acid synthase FeeM domain-containing protein [Thiocystis violacea]|uniref:N-acyl amino acid synthase FeeM domain-containing protein n=1 Tax=Thiocystis violacea TaxID=13725 RepID=UPI001902D30B|nr:hypothetical protein [Thiocystis violacea]MBK1722321.1 hypothetical protein [Thiocystis violacea]